MSLVAEADGRTQRLCTLAALTSLILVVTSTTVLRSGDLPFLVFLLAPYLLLGLLFFAALLLCLGGTILLGLDSYLFHTVPEHRLAQRMTSIVVPMLQSIAGIAISVILQANRMLTGHGRAGAGRSRRH